MTIPQLAQYAGAFYTIVTALATVLPKDWKATKVLAAIGADLRGVHWAA